MHRGKELVSARPTDISCFAFAVNSQKERHFERVLHVAIDRFTGQVIDKQIQVVNE
jgi:hypothetical protein